MTALCRGKALPRIERYLEWDVANRPGRGLGPGCAAGTNTNTTRAGAGDGAGDGAGAGAGAGGTLLAWGSGGESGLDNSPLWDGVAPSSMASVDFSSYAALEMSIVAEMHAALGNGSAAGVWAQRCGVVSGSPSA